MNLDTFNRHIAAEATRLATDLNNRQVPMAETAGRIAGMFIITMEASNIPITAALALIVQMYEKSEAIKRGKKL